MCPARGSFDYGDAAPARRGRRTYRILVVEGGVHLRRLLERTPLNGNLSVESAADVPQALRRLEGGFYHAVLIELPAPRVGPRELFEHVNGQDPVQARRLVFLANDSLDMATLRFLSDAGRPYLTKPVEPPELVDLVIRVASEPVT